MSEFVGEAETSDNADKVRAAIVQRYDRGEDGPIEAWEDASFIVYQVCDRYGFLHKNPLPNVEQDQRALEIERDRTSKWIKMFENWDKYANAEKLKRRIYKGIPDIVRGEAWKKLLGVDIMMEENAGIYEKFRTLSRATSPDIRQIDLDVNRTYRDHIMFRQRFSVKQQALFHVLAAYSLYNMEVGYCQGMSGIAALLLMYMNEEDAFWALSSLLTNNKHHMHGFFIPGFPKLIRFQSHHDKILKKTMPKLQKHLEKEGCYTTLYTLKWFMQCFLDRLPFSLVLRVYDIFLLDGDKTLLAMAYGIMKLHKKQFLKMGLEDLAPYLQETMPNQLVFSDDEMVDLLQESINDLKKTKLDQPPPAGKDEFPERKPGSHFGRAGNLTASKRAKINSDNDRHAIDVPIARQESPKTVNNVHKNIHHSIDRGANEISQQNHPVSPGLIDQNPVASRNDVSSQYGHGSPPRISERLPKAESLEKRHSHYDNDPGFPFENSASDVKSYQSNDRQSYNNVSGGKSVVATKHIVKRGQTSKFYFPNENDSVLNTEHETITDHSNKEHSHEQSNSPVWHQNSHARDAKISEYSVTDARNESRLSSKDSALGSKSASRSPPPYHQDARNDPGLSSKDPALASQSASRSPPPYRPRKVSGRPQDDRILSSNKNPSNRTVLVTAHTVQDSHWDHGRRQPPPYPSGRLTAIENDSPDYGTGSRPLKRPQQRTLPKGIPIKGERTLDIIQL